MGNRAFMLGILIGIAALGSSASAAVGSPTRGTHGAGRKTTPRPSARSRSPVAKRTVTIAGWSYRCRGGAKRSPGGGRTAASRFRARRCRLTSTLAPLRSPAEVGSWQPDFGFNEDWLTELNHLDLAAGAGSNTARVQLRWDQVEPAPGVFDWRQYDLLYRSMAYRGMRPLFLLQGSPCWARPATPCDPGSGDYPVGRGFNRQWVQFVQLAIRRYPSLEGVEFWNEPNLNGVWRPAPNPRRYAKLLRLTFLAAKAVEPGLPVIFGGLVAQFGPSSRAMDVSRFMRRAFAAGAGRFSDGVAVHPYVFPNDASYLLVGIRAQLAIAKQVAGRYGYPAMPLWVTETGLSTRGQGSLSETEQASRLVGLYEMLRQIPGVPVVIFHRLLDVTGQRGDWLTGMGIASPNGAVKPAYCALAIARHQHCYYQPPN